MVADANTHGCQVYKPLAEVTGQPPTLEFAGELTHVIVGDCAAQIEDEIRVDGCCAGLARRAYKVVIELLENVLRYSQGSCGGDKQLPYLRFWRESNHSVVIAVCNMIAQSEVPQFDAWLNHIHSLDELQLKKAIQHAMLTPSRAMRGGAGIGLLTVWQHSQSLEWQFASSANGLEQFTIVARIV